MNSKERRHQKRNALGIAADTLSEEIRLGKWAHVKDIQTKPIVDCFELINELEKRCLEHTQEEYRNALSRSMWVNR